MCRAVIVEDNTLFRKMLKEVLHDRFPTMTIEEQRNGSDLFLIIDSFHPDIVFMDISLPGENGLELTKKIKTDYPDIIVVMLTSHDLPEYRRAAIQNKADYFMLKDSPANDFLALVESICLGKKTTQTVIS